MQLATLSQSITHQLTNLGSLNLRYENYFERARQYQLRGDSENAGHYRDLARRELVNIQNAFNTLNSDINRRYNLSMHAQNRFPAYRLATFSRMTPGEIATLGISRTFLTSPL